jgi:hypothetical protein
MFVGIIKFVCSSVELVHKVRSLLTASAGRPATCSAHLDVNVVRCKAVCSVQFVKQNGCVCFT